MAEELRLNIVSTADSKGLTKAAQDLKETKGEADKLGKSFEEMGDNAEESEQKVSAATKGVRSHAEQIKILRAEYEKTTRTIADLDAQLLGGEGDSKGVRKDLREQRAFLRELERVAKEVKRSSGINFSLGDAGGGIASAGVGGVGRLAGIPTPVVAGLVAAVSAAGPAIGAIIGGAIAGATGTAAMAAGLAAAAHDPRVQSAATAFGHTIAGEFFEGGEAFVQPAIDGLAILKQAAYDLDLDSIFGKAAPTVVTMAEGIAEFVHNLKPGIEKTLERIGPFADEAAHGIADMGDALSDMIDMISSSKGSVDGIRLLFQAIGGTLRFVGAELKFLGDRWHEIINVVGMFSSVGAHTGFAQFDQVVRQMTGHSGELKAQLLLVGGAARDAAMDAGVMTAAVTATTNAINALNTGLDIIRDGFDLKKVQEANNEALFRLREEVKAHGTDLRATTEAGIEHRNMILGLADGLLRERDANIAAGMGADEANAKFRQQVLDLEALLIKLGFSKQAVWDLIGALRNVPSQVNTAIVLDYQTRGVPAGEHSGLRINELFGARASGGPVTAGQPYIVGENQAEMFVPKTNGYVFPSVSAGMNAIGGGMWAAPIYYMPSGNVMWDSWFEQFRTQVQRRGGTLAVVGVRG